MKLRDFGPFPLETPSIRLLRWKAWGWRWHLRVEWKLADLWVGIFWRQRDFACWDLWVCLLPCIPFHLIWCKEISR